jgi:hypothetical protein
MKYFGGVPFKEGKFLSASSSEFCDFGGVPFKEGISNKTPSFSSLKDSQFFSLVRFVKDEIKRL